MTFELNTNKREHKYFERGISENPTNEEKEEYFQEHIKHKNHLRSFYKLVKRGNINEQSAQGKLFRNIDKRDAMRHAIELIGVEEFGEELIYFE